MTDTPTPSQSPAPAPNTPAGESCGVCKFWTQTQPPPPWPTLGMCRALAPQYMYSPDGRAKWLLTADNEWCGAFVKAVP